MPLLVPARNWLMVVVGTVCIGLVATLSDVLAESPVRTETRLSHLMPRDIGVAAANEDQTIEKLLVDTWKNVERKSDDHDRTKLFASFQILVDISKYTLELYGIRDSSDKELLYSCKVGLGSEEYPTPRGSYYVTIIYDDKPLWIPPPRDWAYGQQPSRSVYGGHMIPFFKKIPVSDKSEQTVEHLDNIASPMKMVDTGTYRIHGTDSPWSVGSSQSHGCVRLLNKKVKELADTLKQYVGVGPRGKSENGSYVTLLRPVRLVLH